MSFQRSRERLLDLPVGGRDRAVDFVVVVLARGTNRVGGRRAVGRRTRPAFLQEPFAQLRGRCPSSSCVFVKAVKSERGQHAERILAVVLERLADEEVLKEIHARVARIGAHVELHVVAERPIVAADEPHGVGIAKRFGIRVRLRDRLVAIGVWPWMKPAVSWLRFVADRSRPEGRSVEAMRAAPRFSFCSSSPESSRQPPSFVAIAVAADIRRSSRMTERELAAVVLVRSRFERDAATAARRGAGCRTLTAPCIAPEPYTTPAGPRSTSIGCACSMFTSNSSFTLQKPIGPDRHAVLEKQKHAAGAGPGEHRRANRGEAFLAAVALDHRARQRDS